MKKFLLTVLIVCLILSVFSGCTHNNDTDVNTTTTQSTEKLTTTVATTEATTAAPTTIATTAKATTTKATTAATTTVPVKKHIKSEDLAGKAIIYDDWIITPMTIGGQMLKIKMDGSKVIRPFIRAYTNYYYQVGSWLYYVEGGYPNKVYKIKLDGSKSSLLFEDISLHIISITDDTVYYSKYDGTAKQIFKCDLDFKNQKFLVKITVDSFNLSVHNGYLFYRETVNDTETYYRIDLNNNKKVEMPKLNGACFYKDYIFYTTDKEIIKADLNGKTIKKFSATKAGDIQIQDDVIYFLEDLDPYDSSANRLVCMDFDGSNRKTIHNNKCHNFDVNGDIIILHEFIPEGVSLYQIFPSKINIDGTGYVCYKDAIENKK
ncbi:MAG: DUF5050 domain-containing protein [Clostridia bacterium]|nr:DUF5050 domain-containing protein [Clostridia bacterium]